MEQGHQAACTVGSYTGWASPVVSIHTRVQTMRNLSSFCTAGLYRGLGVTLVRDTPSHGVYFCVYDAAREALDPGSRARGSSVPAASFAAGASAHLINPSTLNPGAAAAKGNKPEGVSKLESG